MNSVSSLALSSLAFGLTLIGNANAQEPSPLDPSGTWALSFGVEQVSFNKEQAAEEEVDDSTTALVFEGEYFFRSHYSATVGLAFLPYDDNASFAENTTDGYKSSEASGLPVYGELGYKRFFGPEGRTSVTARAGMSVMLGSERSISNCTNCTEQDIEIDGGLYGMLGVGARLGQNWLLSAHYKNFFTGDIENAVGVTATYSYR